MSVKDFKFVSPGVFINEIDNSFLPRTVEHKIGPVVVGRARRGLAMTPVTVNSYSEFVQMFGNTVGGGEGNDVYRDGSPQSPMYGTYAAKAFLKANVGPLTYVRLLGEQHAAATAGYAGWKTGKSVNRAPASNGGAYGLFLFTSASLSADEVAGGDIGTGSLAAIWYMDQGDIFLSGTLYGGSGSLPPDVDNKDNLPGPASTGSNGVLIGSSDGYYHLVVSGNVNSAEKIKFTFDDTDSLYIRNVFNTNPTLTSTPLDFYPSASHKPYWLGETFDQALRDRTLTTGSVGIIYALQQSANSLAPSNMEQQASREARTGWFIGQDLGAATSFASTNAQKLFRFIGRGHGEWLQKNVKISIEKVRRSNSNTDAYGTFSVVLRSLLDSDSAVVVMERFDNLTLDPGSPDYVGRRIGDKYVKWDTTERRLVTYGDYDNKSKFVYIEMAEVVDNGTSDAALLPFGFFGPPRFTGLYNLHGSGTFGTQSFCGQVAPPYTASNTTQPPHEGSELVNYFMTGGLGIVHGMGGATGAFGRSAAAEGAAIYLSGGGGLGVWHGSATGSLEMPHVRLRVSASDGGLTNYKDAYYGMQTTRTTTSTVSDRSVMDFHKMLYYNYTAGGGDAAFHSTTGVDNFSYVFTLDDVELKNDGGPTGYYYTSGSRTRGTSYTADSGSADLLSKGVNRFTAPLWGGFDGFNIKKPDPLYNAGMAAAATPETSYIYHTWKRGMDTVADPDFINMNLLVAPGLTQDKLTEHAIAICEERADAMTIIDLPDVYIPNHEAYKATRSDRVGTTPASAETAFRDRFIDSSYGATFYPWVMTADEETGRSLWIPPSVAMMGVLASSEKKSELWFAPAGFNRGGLTDGAAGIPVTGVLSRLSSKERDTLYEANINPIASFPSTGIVVFGQKTTQTRASALDRINVRRLVIFLKKQISILSTQVLFDQNVQATWDRFKALINPFLTDVKTRLGITEYRLILDESTTTPDLIDQNVLYAKIMVKPARAIEYIAIDFVIASTGASFDD